MFYQLNYGGIKEPLTGIEPVNLGLTKTALYQLSYNGISEPTMGIEPMTSFLPRRRSTTELRRHE